MGEVAATIRIMPESIDTSLENLKTAVEKAIPDGMRLHASQEVPVAFGLKALVMSVILSDSEGGTQPLEDAIACVPGVENVQVEQVGLI